MRLCLLAAVLLTTGCSRAVTIVTRPPGARLTIDGSFVGYTPLRLDLGSEANVVRFEYDGRGPVSARLARSWDPGSLLAAVLCPPLLLHPGVRLRLQERYLIDLPAGEDPQELGEVQAVKQP